MNSLGSLPAEVASQIEALRDRLASTLAQRIVSLTLYGSAARGNYAGQQSDVNLLIVIDRADLDAVAALREAFSETQKLRLAPYLVTRDELPQVVQAFPTRVMEMKRGHLVLLGEDVLASVQIDKADLSLRCRQEILNLLMRFRHALLASGEAAALEADLRAYLPPLVKTLRSLLYVRSGQYVDDREEVLRTAARHFDLPEETLMQFSAWRSGRVAFSADEWREVSAAFFDTLQRIAGKLDA